MGAGSNNQTNNERAALATDDIEINKNDEFFISVAKKGIHSFAMLGVMQNQKPRLLARVGKTNNVDPSFKTDINGNPTAASNCNLAVKQVFKHAKSDVQSEPLKLRDEVSYAAYAITYAQYLRFTKLASLTARTHTIQCYLPTNEDDTTAVLSKRVLPKTELSEENSEQEKNIVNRSKYISLSNTCRNTAIDLIEYTQGVDKLTANVSRNFFRDLPLKTTFANGEPADHFYVFPLPPSSYQAGKKQTVLLTKIYTRMETLLKKDPYGEATVAKFNALKTLYNSQAGLLKDNSLEAALENIRQWKASNTAVINTLRAQSFFGKLFTRKSSTANLTDDLEKELNREVQLQARGAL